MSLPSGASCINLLGGGKYLCTICDDPSLLPPAAPPPTPRALGESCSGLATHLISAKGLFGHGNGHTPLHAQTHGRELSAAEIESIRLDGTSKSYTSKRGEGSARASVSRLAKLAKLQVAGALQFAAAQPTASHAAMTPPAQPAFGAAMAGGAGCSVCGVSRGIAGPAGASQT
eukprot:5527578-Prymnesium_polylepis.2